MMKAKAGVHPEMCYGCLKVDNGVCSVYPDPNAWYRRGGCPMKTVEPVAVKKKTITSRKNRKVGVGMFPAGYWG